MLTHLVPHTDHLSTGLLAVSAAVITTAAILFVALHGWMPYGTWRVALEITDDILTTRKQERHEHV